MGFNSNGPSSSIIIIKSNELSNIGNYSAKCTVIGIQDRYVGYKLTDATDIPGKTIQFSAYVKTPIELKLEIYQHVNGSYQSQTVTIPASSDTTSSVQLLIDSDAEHLLFRINYRGTALENEESFFTDNWCLEEV